MMQLAQVSQAVNGQLIGSDITLAGVTTDTRQKCDGELFVALKGDRFDAHDFVAQAQQAGAGAALVERDVDVALPKIIVSDTHQALKDLAAWWRSQFVIPVVGVTGSVGKTTVKEMLGCIFAEIGKGIVTKGNLNNEIGLPLTLLRLKSDDQYAIVEMGMNHAGEISRLTDIAKPTIALINNAAAAHLEGLGTVEAVANAKGEIFEGLSRDGVAIINADDEYAHVWKNLVNERQVVTFGLASEADISADYELNQTGISMQVSTPEGSFSVQLATLGKHNVTNALAAIAVAQSANIPNELIEAGLKNFMPVDGRLNVISIGNIVLIDDTYNANPASMQAAIEVLGQYDNSVLIVGDMGELGASTESAHTQVGDLAKHNEISQVYVCGEFAEFVSQGYPERTLPFQSQEKLLEYLTAEFLSKLTKSNTAVLVKGSRSAKMENVVKHIEQNLRHVKTTLARGGNQ